MNELTLEALLVTLLVVGLSGYRAGRAVAEDDFSQPLRTWFNKRSSGNRAVMFAYILVSCQVCIGFWITMAIGFAWSSWYLAVPWPSDIAIALAATGIQCGLALQDKKNTAD